MNRLTLIVPALIALSNSLAIAQSPPVPERPADIPAMSSEQLRAGYLECDRVTATTSVGPDYMSLCAEIGTVLMHRDFGGDIQRQLDWWRSARASTHVQEEARVAAETVR